MIVLALVAGAVLSLSTGGRADVGLEDLHALVVGGGDELGRTTMRDIRLPRTVIASLIGISLGLAGTILQAITRNPLASPAILGINQGAALGLVIGLGFPAATGLAVDTMAVLGGLAAGCVTFAIGGGFAGRIVPLRLVLGGVAVGAFAFAAVRFAYTMEDEISRSVVRWTVGDIADTRWQDAWPLAVWCAAGTVGAVLLSHRLNMMTLGDASSRVLGGDPRQTLVAGAILSAVLTGASVSAAGPVAFVGLLVPHIARVLFGGDHRVLIPAAAVIGAALMMMADGMSKWMAAPFEVPVGLVAALIGAPYLLYLTLFSEALE